MHLIGIGGAGMSGIARILLARGVADEHPAARVDDRAGVELLLAVAVRQRHVHRRQADGGDLGDGHRPGPAQHGVRGGVGQVHVLDVGQGR